MALVNPPAATALQGREGFGALVTKVKGSGPRVLYHGALAASFATLAGHFPWFFTHNLLNEHLPQAETMWTKLARNALMGFSSSLVSDVTSNSIRVTKVAKQASPTAITYKQAIQHVVEKDGVQGLFFRGLKTRLLANGVQGMLFTSESRPRPAPALSASSCRRDPHLHQPFGAVTVPEQ